MRCSPEALDASRSIILRARMENLTDSVDALAEYLEKLMRARDRRLRATRRAK